MTELLSPAQIEKRSFEIINETLSSMGITLSEEEKPVTMRAIHASADFDYAKNLYYSKDAVPKAKALLLGGSSIVTDTQMAMAGINKSALSRLGGRVFCFMSDEDVAIEAKKRGVTRAAVSMEKALSTLKQPLIFAIGNAPTALIKLCEMADLSASFPNFVIASPVGFVNVEDSKQLIIDSGFDCIVARGRKGGSAIAAAICNALLYDISR